MLRHASRSIGNSARGLVLTAGLLVGPLLRGVLAQPVQAAPMQVGAFLLGTVISLVGTTHLWFVDEKGQLHWGSDTRALAGHTIKWDRKVELSYDQLSSLTIGDPWLSTGLMNERGVISLAKWETSDPKPTLQHVQSLDDLKAFGINAANDGQYVLNQS